MTKLVKTACACGAGENGISCATEVLYFGAAKTKSRDTVKQKTNRFHVKITREISAWQCATNGY